MRCVERWKAMQRGIEAGSVSRARSASRVEVHRERASTEVQHVSRFVKLRPVDDLPRIGNPETRLSYPAHDLGHGPRVARHRDAVRGLRLDGGCAWLCSRVCAARRRGVAVATREEHQRQRQRARCAHSGTAHVLSRRAPLAAEPPCRARAAARILSWHRARFARRPRCRPLEGTGTRRSYVRPPSALLPAGA